MGKLDGRVAVITGAGSGQGAAAARLFASEGCAVVVADVNEETGQQVTGELKSSGAQAAFALCDVSDAAQVRAMIGLATTEFGRLDVLYNNAGLWFSAQGNYRPGVTDAPVAAAGGEHLGPHHQRQPQGHLPGLQVRDPGDAEGRRRVDHQRLQHRRAAGGAGRIGRLHRGQGRRS